MFLTQSTLYLSLFAYPFSTLHRLDAESGVGLNFDAESKLGGTWKDPRCIVAQGSCRSLEVEAKLLTSSGLSLLGF